MAINLFETYDKSANRIKTMIGEPLNLMDTESVQTPLGVPLSGRTMASDMEFGTLASSDMIESDNIVNGTIYAASNRVIASGAVTSAKLQTVSGVSGNYTTASFTINNRGIITAAANGTFSISDLSPSPAGTYSRATSITVNSKGQVTAATNDSDGPYSYDFDPFLADSTLGDGSHYWANLYCTTLYFSTIRSIVSSVLEFDPSVSGSYDLGSSTYQWKDLYIDGTAGIDSLDLHISPTTGLTADKHLPFDCTASVTILLNNTGYKIPCVAA